MFNVCECVFNYLHNNGVVQFLTPPLEGTKFQTQGVGFRHGVLKRIAAILEKNVIM